VAAQWLANRGAVGQPPHSHRPIDATGDGHRGAVRQRTDCHCIHCAVVAGEDLMADGLMAAGPAGLPGPVGDGGCDAVGQAAIAEPVCGQLELACPYRPVEGGEDVCGLPIDRGRGPRGGRSRGVEVGDQPRRFDADQVERIIQELIEPAGGTGMISRVFAGVPVLPAGRPGLAHEGFQEQAFVAGLASCGEELVS